MEQRYRKPALRVWNDWIIPTLRVETIGSKYSVTFLPQLSGNYILKPKQTKAKNEKKKKETTNNTQCRKQTVNLDLCMNLAFHCISIQIR